MPATISLNSGTIVSARAAWVHGRELRLDCAVVLRNGTIKAILTDDEAARTGADKQYQQFACDLLLPGLINAHCHLEYTGLQGALPRGSVPFGDWLQAVVEAKTSGANSSPAEAVQQGARLLLEGGCTTVVDCVSAPALVGNYPHLPLRSLPLFEVLGLTEARADETWDRAQLALARGKLDAPLQIGTGLAPHAPYSVGSLLRGKLLEYLAAHPETICGWHLAETPDEMELLETGSGSIAEFLTRNGMPLPDRLPLPAAGAADDAPGRTHSSAESLAIAFLQQAELLGSCDLTFHGNYLEPADLPHFVAPRALVHCPGTHAYFDRDPFPLAEYLRAGVNVCLGTDSLASSDSLSMLKMLQLAAEQNPTLGGGQLLDLATRNPARTRALAGAPRLLGIIAPGAAADLALLRAHVAPATSLRDMLVDDNTTVRQVLVNGASAFAASTDDSR